MAISCMVRFNFEVYLLTLGLVDVLIARRGTETSHHLRVHPSSLSVFVNDIGTTMFVIHILTAVIFVFLLLLSSGLLISSAIWVGNLLHTIR